ncbi:hypothetical protein PENTCL1PPCAC_19482, partial [Pristionchus entomophagus]
LHVYSPLLFIIDRASRAFVDTRVEPIPYPSSWSLATLHGVRCFSIDGDYSRSDIEGYLILPVLVHHRGDTVVLLPLEYGR